MLLESDSCPFLKEILFLLEVKLYSGNQKVYRMILVTDLHKGVL